VSAFQSGEVKRALLRKGFVSDSRSHHIFFSLVRSGQETEAETYISHGRHEIDNYLQGRMAKQLALKLSEFQELIRCSLSYDKLLKLLIDRGKIKP